MLGVDGACVRVPTTGQAGRREKKRESFERTEASFAPVSFFFGGSPLRTRPTSTNPLPVWGKAGVVHVVDVSLKRVPELAGHRVPHACRLVCGCREQPSAEWMWAECLESWCRLLVCLMEISFRSRFDRSFTPPTPRSSPIIWTPAHLEDPVRVPVWVFRVSRDG